MFLDLLCYLNEEKKFTLFVFLVLKRYSEEFFGKFLNSNLVAFTNKLAEIRRDEQYGKRFLETVLAL